MPNVANVPIRAYACRVGDSNHETIVNHISPGRAKSWFLAELELQEVRFTDIRCRQLGDPVATKGFKRMAHARGIEFARPGMCVKIGKRSGRIIGCTDGDNLEVLFDEGSTGVCHPHSEVTYCYGDGSVIMEFPRP